MVSGKVREEFFMYRLVVLATFTKSHEAHVAKGILESAGIPAFLSNEHSSLFEPSALVTLQVREVDQKAAKEIFATVQFQERGSQASSRKDQLCSRCGTTLPSAKRGMFAFLALFSQSYRISRCENCGFEQVR